MIFKLHNNQEQMETNNRLIGWLVFYGTSTQDRSICANLPEGNKKTQSGMQQHCYQLVGSRA